MYIQILEYMNTHISFLCNSQKSKQPKCLSTVNGYTVPIQQTLLSSKKKWTIYTCCNVDESQNNYPWSSQKSAYSVFSFTLNVKNKQADCCSPRDWKIECGGWKGLMKKLWVNFWGWHIYYHDGGDNSLGVCRSKNLSNYIF